MPTLTATPLAFPKSKELEQEFELDIRISLPSLESDVKPLNLVSLPNICKTKYTSCTDFCTNTCGGQHCTSAC